MKKKTCILGILLWSCFVQSAHAATGVRINEIMYDLKDIPNADHEWVELLNTSTETVSLQGLKFSDGSNHVLNKPPLNGGQGSISIDSGGYVILSGNAATFVADHPDSYCHMLSYFFT